MMTPVTRWSINKVDRLLRVTCHNMAKVLTVFIQVGGGGLLMKVF